MKLRFTEEHMRQFSAASLDFNPMHLSELYARRTSTGERVVYGILGFLACLKELPLPPGMSPFAVRIDFKGAMALGLDYSVTAKQEGTDSIRLTIMDGSATVMRSRLQFRPGAPETTALPDTGIAPLSQARQLPVSDLQPGLRFRGRYSPPQSAYLELLALLEIDRAHWGDSLPVAAICTSYLTGMELPGESATYSGLKLQLDGAPSAPADFDIGIEDYNDHFGMIQSRFSLSSASHTFAHGEIAAIARSSRTRISATGLDTDSGRFAGKTALVIGASRGLGAAIALDLVAEGGTVIGAFAQSQDDADALVRSSRGCPGRLIMERGDASDLSWCSKLKGRIVAEFGGLDLLVCSAVPPMQPLRVEEACYERIRAYLDKGFALFAAPLSVFLELISRSGGCVLTISSVFVAEPPEIWPQYVSLKAAVEGLARTAAAGNPKVTFWIARPTKILTDMTNTPLGRLDGQEPQAVSHRILEKVLSPAAAGTAHFCG